jgi:hypothetical protein
MQLLSFDYFARHLRETFSVSLGETSVDMTLVEANRRPPRIVAPGLRADPFNLYFKSQSHVLLPQKMYPFRMPGSEIVSIFIVPIAREKDGVIYEAVFN